MNENELESKIIKNVSDRIIKKIERKIERREKLGKAIEHSKSKEFLEECGISIENYDENEETIYFPKYTTKEEAKELFNSFIFICKNAKDIKELTLVGAKKMIISKNKEII